MVTASEGLLLLGLLGRAVASPAPYVTESDIGERGIFPTISINIPAGSITGLSRINIEAFTGIPFAQPPVGPLRLAPPKPLDKPLVNFDATQQSAACPQFLSGQGDPSILPTLASIVTESPLFKKALKVQEDCLNINVFRPKGTKAGDNLPVLFWIFGGGFELGWNSMYDGGIIVSRGIDLGKPFIFVAVNYRVAGWGFMAGKEIKAAGAGNLGHRDQRLGLEWTADNIAAFGGDPSKVTIWGESAGSISVFNQMALYGGNINYKGKPLFRGAMMNSGSTVPIGPIDSPKAQKVYDQVVAASPCAGQADTLNCLRNLPYDQFYKAANSVPNVLGYNSVSLSYLPRYDGDVLPDCPVRLLKQGKYAAVPMIIGDQEDEGTIFSLSQLNTSSNTRDIVDYMSKIFVPGFPIDKLTEIISAYPADITAGSPFRTFIFNEWYPGFKRMAALLGDLVFTLSRRWFLSVATTLHPEVPAWSYLSSYYFGIPIVGTFHGSDLLEMFYLGGIPTYLSNGLHGYYFNFLYNLDPNNASGGTSPGKSSVNVNWPKWTNANRQMINFYKFFFNTIKDDFRQQAGDVIGKYMEDIVPYM